MKHFSRFSKILAVLLACIAALTAAACTGGVDLETGAVISLNVQTQAAEVTVASSYGAVSGGGYEYTITLDKKKDVTVTVSADGYKTENVVVTVADMAEENCEKTVALTKPLGKFVRFSVKGITKNVSVVCGGKAFEKKGGLYSAEVTEEELRSGVKVSADGAEDYLYIPDAEDAEGNYILKSVYLVAEGKRLLELYSREYMYEYYAVDGEENFIPLLKFTDAEVYSARIVTDKTYEGTIAVYRGQWDADPVAAFSVTEESPVYGNVVFADGEGKDSIRYELYGAQNANPDLFYLEKDGNLERTYLQQSADYGYWEVYAVDAERLWYIDESGGTAKYVDLGYGVTLDFADFEEETLDFSYVVYDEVLRRVMTEVTEILWRKQGGEFQTAEVHDGVFSIEGTTDEYYEFRSVGNDRCWSAYDYRIAGGKLCKAVHLWEPAEFRLKVYDENGLPVTGANVSAGFGSFTESDTEGVYTGSFENTPWGTAVNVLTGGMTKSVYLPESAWTADSSERTFTAEVRLRKYTGFLLNMRIMPSRMEVSYSGEGEVSVNEINEYLYHVRAPIGATFTLKITYVKDYTSTGMPIEGNFSKEISVTQAMQNNGVLDIYDDSESMGK